MTIPLSDALDEAQLVKTEEIADTTRLAVWHGGHTVNTYVVSRDFTGSVGLRPNTSMSVGDLRTGEVTEEEAREAMDRLLAPGRQSELDESA